MTAEVKMEPVFEKSFSIRSYELDPNKRVRPNVLLNYIQEASVDHSRLLGISMRDLLRHGLTWVLSRMHLTLYDSLSFADKLLVRTWPSTCAGRFSCREFELVAADGRIIGVATGSFAVLDIATRRPVDICERLPSYPLLSRRAIADDFATLPRLGDSQTELSFIVGRREIDINNHVNNAVYVEWALETVPEEIADRCRLLDLEIAFRAEAFYGETVVARAGRVQDDGPATFLHQIVRSENASELARIVTKWGNKE